ncbi:heme-degrading domain-containing protein [Vibrio sp. JC009]|uniref:heme-degrading domain-containing protein n=1 Tax=Vibrio sp. JC009 TaxID=2912314 RepID=UPI0023AFA25C|nr:heme-degrading domain-containing protein [Vibrio sp. JC009]WED24878.1 heme-degrading domain-containing protein [Vibrio sp. JC009]
MKELLNQILEQEKRLQFTHFSHERAWELGCALKEAAEQKVAGVAIDITMNGLCLFSYAMPGTRIDNAEWIRRKKNVVERYQNSSWYIGNYYKNKGVSIEQGSLVDAKEYAPFGGSFPLAVRNVGIIGTITVSGLPQVEDHQLIVDVLEGFLSEEEKI